jgi:hypothetical protein
MKFYLGTHQPHWLGKVSVPLFVSVVRLRDMKAWPRAQGDWALDSGGFSELSLRGKWTVTPRQYAAEVCRAQSEIGRLDFAAIQDWMCEPFILAKTGLSIKQHQERTIDSYLELSALAPEVPWLPVIQGWAMADYWRHVDQYRKRGVELLYAGVGSVCRRQGTAEAETIMRTLTSDGTRVHAFGFKKRGLAQCASILASADSMAWSYDARRKPPLPGCTTHINCANCIKYALMWGREMEGIAACG